ncbi:MAG TPA: hypothetical protein VFQ23_04770 [Anaerolineales bacterium]|nr:hypothetical protein [Anaerolineales bacterium]
MMLLRKSILLLSLFALTACLQKPVFNIEVVQPASTAEFIASATPFTAWTEMAMPSPTPVIDEALPIFSPTPVVWSGEFSPVLYGGNRYGMSVFLLLGGVATGEWITPETSALRFGGEATYSLHTLTQISRYFIWGQVPQFSYACGNYFVHTDPGLDEPGFVGVLDGWNVTKREQIELSANDLLYQQTVIDFLTAMGVAAFPPSTLQAFRVDIEGDGVDEVFISATHLDDPKQTPKGGDYSIVLMRKVVGNDAVTKLVVGDHYNAPRPEISHPRTYTLANFIDLNQDGVLEVVVDVKKWEGFGGIVLEVNGQDVTARLSAEC